MLEMAGEWRVLHSSDREKAEKFNLPENCLHIATWHGQVF
jgi:hypothetical protein